MCSISGIYEIRNIVTNDIYIGASKNIKRRFCEHKSPKKIRTGNNEIYKAIRRYGLENFQFNIIESCDPKDLFKREEYYISLLKPKYSMNNGGKGNPGHMVNSDSRNILSQKLKHVWNQKTDDEKEFIIKNNLKGPSKGHEVSRTTRDKIRNKLKNRIMSEEQKKKISISLKGKQRTNESHKKIVIATKITNNEKIIFQSVKEAAIFLKVNPSTVTHTLKGDQKSCKGYRIEYLN